ncbi:hypothetical protein COY27_05485 [Candidatus Woesearchaeota archaeon CG_4_10_14_0_2_um_filter_33_13]|nr:MAG: hypothetical protein COY27_05485 [Candidatus Woesearchaeota archaeon CG_4_10_14_0_2_um_filter_33_13]
MAKKSKLKPLTAKKNGMLNKLKVSKKPIATPKKVKAVKKKVPVKKRSAVKKKSSAKKISVIKKKAPKSSDRENKNRGKTLQKLTEDKKKYIHHVPKNVKKVINSEIKKQRTILTKVPIKQEPNKKTTSTKRENTAKTWVSKREDKRKQDLGKSVKQLKKEEAKEVKENKLAGKVNLSAIKDSIQKQLSSLRGKEKDSPTSTRGKVESKEYIFSLVPGFDDLLDDGIPRGASILLAGGAGSGKTIFGLQTLYEHAKKGEKCLYMSFEENEERLIKHMEKFGWDPKKLIKKGTLMIKRYNPFDITRSVDALLMKVKGELLIDVDPIIFPNHFKPTIVVLDSLSAIASAFSGKEDSYRIYIQQLFRLFEKIGATSFLITETEQVPKIFSTSGVEEFLADGIIVIYNIKRGNIRERAVEVLKMRGASHQTKIVAMSIGEDGVEVFPEQEVFGGVDGES